MKTHKKINEDDVFALSLKVKELIKKLIVKRKFRVGDRLPTYRELSKSLNVSLVTVQQAMHLLNQDGFTQARPGKGTILAMEIDAAHQSLSQIAFILNEAKSGAFKPGYLNDLVRGLVIGAETIHSEIRLISNQTDGAISPSELAIHGTDAAVLVGVSNEEYLSLFAESDLPTVVVDSYSRDIPLEYVAVDNRQATYQVLDYLYALGHRHITYISNYTRDKTVPVHDAQSITLTSDGEERMAAYKAWMTDKGLAGSIQVVPPIIDAKTRKEAQVVYSQIANQKTPVSALLGSDSTTANEAIKVLDEKGMRCPQDISIAGIIGPALSPLQHITKTIFDFEAMGRASMSLLSGLNGNPIKSSRVERMSATLVCGQTCLPINQSSI